MCSLGSHRARDAGQASAKARQLDGQLFSFASQNSSEGMSWWPACSSPVRRSPSLAAQSATRGVSSDCRMSQRDNDNAGQGPPMAVHLFLGDAAIFVSSQPRRRWHPSLATVCWPSLSYILSLKPSSTPVIYTVFSKVDCCLFLEPSLLRLVVPTVCTPPSLVPGPRHSIISYPPPVCCACYLIPAYATSSLFLRDSVIVTTRKPNLFSSHG